jgi:hypothetical protein
VNGFGTGVVSSLLWSQRDEGSLALAGTLVDLAAMAESDVPLVLLKASDPKTWGVSGWFSDLLPHLIYGFVMVATYEAVPNREGER